MGVRKVPYLALTPSLKDSMTFETLDFTKLSFLKASQGRRAERYAAPERPHEDVKGHDFLNTPLIEDISVTVTFQQAPLPVKAFC